MNEELEKENEKIEEVSHIWLYEHPWYLLEKQYRPLDNHDYNSNCPFSK